VTCSTARYQTVRSTSDAKPQGLRKSPYANPFPVKTYGLAESLLRYRLHIEGFDMATLERDLTGKDLACCGSW
jgi:hypothetical protein